MLSINRIIAALMGYFSQNWSLSSSNANLLAI